MKSAIAPKAFACQHLVPLHMACLVPVSVSSLHLIACLHGSWFLINWTGRMGAGEKKNACSVQYRRPFGCAVLSIADLLTGETKDDLVLKVYM